MKKEDIEVTNVKKLSDNHSFYSTNLNSITGMPELPEVGKPAFLFNYRLHGGIRTSNVTEVQREGNIVTFKTLNSTYQVEIVNG